MLKDIDYKYKHMNDFLVNIIKQALLDVGENILIFLSDFHPSIVQQETDSPAYCLTFFKNVSKVLRRIIASEMLEKLIFVIRPLKGLSESFSIRQVLWS